MLRRTFFLICSVAAAQSPDEVLREFRVKLNQFIRTLPKYTCTETIDREYFEPGPSLSDRAHCPAILPDLSGRLPTLRDRVRLEVTVSEGREIHAWPGASEFDLRNIDEIVPPGPISTGAFGTYLMEVFQNPGTSITFTGEHAEDGLLDFAYRTPVETSRYRVSKLRQVVGHGGTFQLDRRTFEIVSLTVETDPLSPETEMCLDRTVIDFRRGADFPTPQQSILTIFEPNSGVSRTRTTFAGCRQYGAQSTIRFGEDDTPALQRSAGKPPDSIREKIRFSFRNTEEIDFDVAAIGDRISGRVFRTTDRNRLPEGSVVTGRITQSRQFENRTEIGFQLERALIRGIPVPLSAVSDRDSKSPGGLRIFRGAVRPRSIPAGQEFDWVSVASK